MKVISTNIGHATTVMKNNKAVQTGIYKTHVAEGIYLGLTDVLGDAVMDRKNHGGIDKACYLYAADHYPFWEKEYPELNFSHGMFGENITVQGMDESTLRIGDVFQIGEAVVQVSEPRRPCSILGIRFGTQQMVKQFNNSSYPGTYVRILKEGKVKHGDSMELIKSQNNNPTVTEIFSLFSNNDKNHQLAQRALSTDTLSDDCKNSIRKRFKL